MKTMFGAVMRLGIVVTGVALCMPAHAARVEYVVADLADTTPGQDLWRYDYAISEHSFLQSQFLDIYFNPALYGPLTAGLGPNADWDVLILQQPNDANLPPFDRGIYDAFALTDAPSLSGFFSVNFVYLGSGTPGAQAFELYGADAGLLESGMTTPFGAAPIPEPATTLLLISGLCGGALYRRRRA